MAAKDYPARTDLVLPARNDGASQPAPSADARKFKPLYETWFPHVARWIRALGGPASDQDDLLQEVFVVVHRRLPDFDGENPAGWLYRITARQVRDFRRRKWIKQIFKRSIPLSESIPSPGPTPVTMLEAYEDRQLLDRLLSRLSEPLRASFVLFEIEGYTAEEIARMQGMSINTVRARILRARQRLTADLEKRGDAARGGSA
jgi:RNA polymerase sigma-70 factor (ECF subfamily)